MEEALLIYFGMQRNSPIVLPVPVPIPSSEEVCHIVHFLRRLWRVGKVIAHLLLELLLVLGLVESVPAIIKDLTVAVEQDSVDFALPTIKSFHRRYPIVRGPVRIFWILQERRNLNDVRLLRHKKVTIKPGAGHVGVVLVRRL